MCVASGVSITRTDTSTSCGLQTGLQVGSWRRTYHSPTRCRGFLWASVRFPSQRSPLPAKFSLRHWSKSTTPPLAAVGVRTAADLPQLSREPARDGWPAPHWLTGHTVEDDRGACCHRVVQEAAAAILRAALQQAPIELEMISDHATRAEAAECLFSAPLAIQILGPVQHVGERR